MSDKIKVATKSQRYHAGRCDNCSLGLLFVYEGSRAILKATCLRGYVHRIGKGPYFEEGDPKVWTLRFNIHNQVPLRPNLTLGGVRRLIEHFFKQTYTICPNSLLVCDHRDLYK